jgi:drug/metabolite transporter (DMT)-like permease
MGVKIRAHFALLTATIIFGLHYIVAKTLMTGHLTPMQLIFLRLLFATIIFWIFQKLFVHEKVNKKDLLQLAILGFIGFAANQALFYEGLNLTSPVDASLIHILNPILVLILAGIIIKEKITGQKLGGILLGSARGTDPYFIRQNGKHPFISGSRKHPCYVQHGFLCSLFGSSKTNSCKVPYFHDP